MRRELATGVREPRRDDGPAGAAGRDRARARRGGDGHPEAVAEQPRAAAAWRAGV